MSDTKPEKKPVELDEAGRVRAAMVAAGRAEHGAESLPDKHRKQLAELVSVSGVAQPGVRERAITILRAAGMELKAEGIEEIGK